MVNISHWARRNGITTQDAIKIARDFNVTLVKIGQDVSLVQESNLNMALADKTTKLFCPQEKTKRFFRQEKIFTGPALKKGVTRKKRAASQAAFKRETLQAYLTLSEYGLPTTEKEVKDFKKFLDENNLDNVKKFLNPDFVPSPEE